MNICCAPGYFEHFFLIQGRTEAYKVDTHPCSAVQDQSVFFVKLKFWKIRYEETLDTLSKKSWWWLTKNVFELLPFSIFI